VAEYLQVAREQLSYIETGSRPVDVLTLQQLADLYGYHINWFVDEAAKDDDQPVAHLALRTNSLSVEDMELVRWVKRFAINLDELNQLTEGADAPP
jgi:transcriptional regulator with XRE-family HTH domain